MSKKLTGKTIARRWGLDVKHALYRENGGWYHRLRRFPGALCDSNGYIVFETKEEYDACPALQIKKDVHVPGGIASIQGYIRMVLNGVEHGRQANKSTNQLAGIGSGLVREGEAVEITLTRYERDPRARKACLAYYGDSCTVCGLSFEARYGSIGKGFIHVHHLETLASVGGGVDIDPIRDLRPVCPNCHAMLHRKIPPLTIGELQAMLRRVP